MEGAVTAILFNIPGSVENAPTAFDGYPMTRQGHSGKAIGYAVTCSAFGGTLAAVAMMAFTEPAANFAISNFGPVEIFALVFFGLAVVAGIGTKSIAKGWLSVTDRIADRIDWKRPDRRHSQIQFWDAIPARWTAFHSSDTWIFCGYRGVCSRIAVGTRRVRSPEGFSFVSDIFRILENEIRGYSFFTDWFFLWHSARNRSDACRLHVVQRSSSMVKASRALRQRRTGRCGCTRNRQ